MSQQTYPASGAYATFNSQTIRSLADWTITDKLETAQIMSNTRGLLEHRAVDLMGTVSITPRVYLSTLIAQLGLFVPYNDPASIGTCIFPGSDLPFVVQTKDGKSITYAKGALMKMPDVTFHPKKPLLGAAEIGLLVATGSALGASASYDAEATSTYTEPTETLGTEYRDNYTLTIGTGGSAFTVAPDDDGIVLKPVAKLERVKPSQEPTRNYRISEITATLEFRPLDMDCDTFYSSLAALSGSTAPVMGGPISATGAQVVIQSATGATSSGKLKCLIPMASRVQGGIEASNSKPRVQKVTLQLQQTYSAGAWQKLFTFSAL